MTKTVAEIDAEIAKLQKERIEAQETVKAETKTKIDALLEEGGFTIVDLYPDAGKPKKSKGNVKPKWAHPDDPSLTYTGHGRKPKWVEDWLASGKTVKDLAPISG